MRLTVEVLMKEAPLLLILFDEITPASRLLLTIRLFDTFRLTVDRFRISPKAELTVPEEIVEKDAEPEATEPEAREPVETVEKEPRLALMVPEVRLPVEIVEKDPRPQFMFWNIPI